MLRAKRLLAVGLPLALAALDRLAKWQAFAALPQERGAVLVSGWGFGYFQNRGLIFSLFPSGIATVAAALAFLALALWALRRRLAGRPLLERDRWAFWLIALGGASNLYDRLAHGGVIDYLLFARSAWNIADIMILAGIALLLKRAPKGG